jgi:hypothetical protein
MTQLHPETFEYLAPTEEQKKIMEQVREATRDYAAALEVFLPDGPDKTYTLRKLREVAMWSNVSITREADGTPRADRQINPADYPADHQVEGDLGSVP